MYIWVVVEPEDRENSAHWAEIEEATELLLEHEHEKALELLRDAIKKNPRNPYAYHYVGVAMFELKRFDAARDAYRAAIHVAPKYLGARIGLSHALRLTGEFKEALQQAEVALRQSPNDGDALFALGLAHLSRGDAGEAISALEKFLTTKPEFEAGTEAQTILRELYARQGPQADNDN